MEYIHGHTIMNWLAEASSPPSFQELERRMEEQFGTDTRFKTCNTQGHTLAELLAVLQERGKIVCTDGTYRANTHNMCSHE